MVEGARALAPARRAFAALGLPLGRAPLIQAGRVTWVLSHRRMEVLVVAGDARTARRVDVELGPPYGKAAWLNPKDPGVGVSALANRVLAVALRATARERD
jgi:hypothetical protein